MTDSSRGIVVAYDDSRDAKVALSWAIQTAIRSGLPVLAVVADPPERGVLRPLDRDEQQLEHARVAAEGLLKEADVEGIAEYRPGTALPVLLDAAEGAAMIVAGSLGHGQFGGAMIGSVSQHLARHASCPVVVARPAARPEPSRIVVGVDGSGGSGAALEFACLRAEQTHEPVVAVHGWRLSNVPVDKHGNVPTHLVQRMAEHERLLSESVAGLREQHPDVDLQTESIPVVAAQALADASLTASLVVVGSRGAGAFPGLLLGSVSQEVLTRAHCPVAIVR
jgi:nucleotide-binding universal stress UspA family protein